VHSVGAKDPPGIQEKPLTGERNHDQIQPNHHHFHGILGILLNANRSFNQGQATQAAAGIAYYTLFSLFPLIILLIAVGSFILQDQRTQQYVIRLVQVVIPVAPDIVVNNIQEVLKARGPVGFIGIITLAWSASGALDALVRNINRAWPQAHARGFLDRRLVDLGLIAGLIVVLISASLLTTLLGFLPASLSSSIAQASWWDFLTILASTVLGLGLFAGLYRWVPDVHVSWSAALWSGTVISIAWQISTRLFTWYLQSGLVQYKLVYGSLGAIVILMLWIYLNSVLLLFGAHLCAAIQQHLEANP
jgi:membrane protein